MAAENANTWSGTALLLPLFGAFITDAFLGRYLTIIIASLLYVLVCHIFIFTFKFERSPDRSFLFIIKGMLRYEKTILTLVQLII
ncbi:putative proton-dependent oligopeptide transporter family [Helianthus anomalus]